jgi:hypothetical protein
MKELRTRTKKKGGGALEISENKWTDNIKGAVSETGFQNSSDLVYGQVAGFYSHGNQNSSFIKSGKFLGYVSD